MSERSARSALGGVVAVPISVPGVLKTGLLLINVLTILLKVCDINVALVAKLAIKLSKLATRIFFRKNARVILTTLAACLIYVPLVLVFKRVQKTCLNNSVLTFFLKCDVLFFGDNVLTDVCPFSTTLVLIKFSVDRCTKAAVSSAPLLTIVKINVVIL